jgi:anti-anti-sigma factor
LAGEIDINVCEELVAQITPALQDGGNGDIVLDLSGLRFIDSCGISAIIQMAKQLDGSRTLFLSSPQSQVARVFDIVGIDRMHPLRIINDGG